jgi:hypothetical protein
MRKSIQAALQVMVNQKKYEKLNNKVFVPKARDPDD